MSKKYEELFKKLREIKSAPARRKTFMDISGYPHYENVVSNILSFYFDDSEEHGMKDLWFKSLMSISGETITSQNITVEREVATEKGNRIDLLITSEDYIVCIENKIFADLYNDLNDYMKKTKEKNKGNAKVEKYYVLSVKPVTPNVNEFESITYNQLFAELRRNMGDYLESCDNTWLSYMKDFMLTIESFEMILGGKKMMNTAEFETIYKEYEEEISNLITLRDKYYETIKQDVATVQSCVVELMEKEKIDSLYRYKINQWKNTYNSKNEMRSSVVVDFNLDQEGKKIITIETSRDVWGWHISLFNRTKKALTKTQFNQILSNRMIAHPSKPEKIEAFGEHHIIKNLDANRDLNEIAIEIIDMIKEMIPAFEEITKAN